MAGILECMGTYQVQMKSSDVRTSAMNIFNTLLNLHLKLYNVWDQYTLVLSMGVCKYTPRTCMIKKIYLLTICIIESEVSFTCKIRQATSCYESNMHHHSFHISHNTQHISYRTHIYHLSFIYTIIHSNHEFNIRTSQIRAQQMGPSLENIESSSFTHTYFIHPFIYLGCCLGLSSGSLWNDQE